MTKALVLASTLVWLSLPACKSEQTLRHEKLALALRAPVAELCRFWPAESAGCNNTCLVHMAAIEGHASVVASRELVAIEPTGDGDTDSRLKSIAVTAHAIMGSLAAECPVAFDRDEPITPELTRCADARKREASTVRELVQGVDELVKVTQQRTGVALPSPTHCSH